MIFKLQILISKIILTIFGQRYHWRQWKKWHFQNFVKGKTFVYRDSISKYENALKFVGNQFWVITFCP